MTIETGQTVLGRYRVDNFLEQTGEIKVFLVHDQVLNAPLLMKVIQKDQPEGQALDLSMPFQQMKREATLIMRLRHPNIATFYGVEQTADAICLLEDYIDGQTLKNIQLKQRGQPMEIGDALVYLKTLSTALSHAHKSGIVHGGIKPSVILVNQVGKIFITDFGSVRITARLLGKLIGTPIYFSPELAETPFRLETVDHLTPAADIYSTGVIFFELLTGRKPFGEDSQDPRAYNSKLSESLVSVMLKALAKDPRQRYISIMNFLEQACKAADITTVADILPQSQIIQEGSEGLLQSPISIPPPVSLSPPETHLHPGGKLTKGNNFPPIVPDRKHDNVPVGVALPQYRQPPPINQKSASTVPEWFLFILSSVLLYGLAMVAGVLLYQFLR
jgi:serine/threonine protein kinase